MEEKEINLYDYWVILRKNLWFVICIFTVAVFIAMIASFLTPKTYRATTSILPPQGNTSTSGLGGLAPLAGINLPERAGTSDIFVAILKSKTMADELIKKFNLQQVYQCKTLEETRRKLSVVNIGISKEKVISVSVVDRNPQMAADMANFYISTLDRLNQTLTITSAGQTRKFMEERLTETKKSLKNAEERLESYQVTHKIFAEGQEGAGKGVGELQGKLIAAKIELKAKEKYLTGENSEIINLRNVVAETEKTLTSLPPLETELARLTRELVTQETVYTILVSRYEQAKIEEARDIPTVQVLDRASVPEKKYKPNIRKNMALSGVLALFLGIFISFLKEYMTRKNIHQ